MVWGVDTRVWREFEQSVPVERKDCGDQSGKMDLETGRSWSSVVLAALFGDNNDLFLLVDSTGSSGWDFGGVDGGEELGEEDAGEDEGGAEHGAGGEALVEDERGGEGAEDGFED